MGWMSAVMNVLKLRSLNSGADDSDDERDGGERARQAREHFVDQEDGEEAEGEVEFELVAVGLKDELKVEPLGGDRDEVEDETPEQCELKNGGNLSPVAEKLDGDDGDQEKREMQWSGGGDRARVVLEERGVGGDEKDGGRRNPRADEQVRRRSGGGREEPAAIDRDEV